MKYSLRSLMIVVLVLGIAVPMTFVLFAKLIAWLGTYEWNAFP